MKDSRQRIVTWVGMNIMPHEAAVRAWLRRFTRAPQDVDDLIQEAYCRIAALEDVSHIDRPDRYFFQIVRNLLGEQLRRARVVQFETVAEIDSGFGDYETPSPERAIAAESELTRVRRLIDALPERCRQILLLRKFEGLSQRDVARRLGVTEGVVENESVKGMRLIMQALRETEDDAGERIGRTYGQPAKRRRD